MVDTLKMKIDGKEVEFVKGQTILEAAESAGIYIPKLCVIDELTPYGGCRLCTIKVIGDRKPYQSACSTPAVNGMDIITKDEELQEMRKDVLQMRLSEHPSGCLVCGHNEKCEDLSNNSIDKSKYIFGCFACSNKLGCEVRKLMEYLDIKELKFDFEYKNVPIEDQDPFYDRNYNLCVLCGKCVRVCNELRGIGAIYFINRGHKTRISTGGDVLHIESNCQFCGACVDACPTGTLTVKNTKWVKDTDNFTESVCGFCNLNCDFHYFSLNDKLVESVPTWQACVIGRFCAAPFNNGSERLATPLIKTGKILSPVKWSRAYTEVAQKLSRYKPDEIAVLASPDLSNESAYTLKKFTSDIIKTNNVATITDGISMKYYDQLGAAATSFEEIQKSDLVLLVNANVQVSHPVLLVHLKKAKDNGSHITSLSFKDINLPNETIRLLDEDSKLSASKMVEKINEFAGEKSKVTIILGEQSTDDITGSLVNLAIQNDKVSIITLRGRTNIDGVFGIIPNTEDEIVKKIQDGKIKALYTTERIRSELLDKVEFLALHDIYPSEASKFADVMLPVCTFIEDSGSLLNAERKLLHFNRSAERKGDSKPDWEIFSELSEKKIRVDQKDSDSLRFESLENITKKLPPVKFAPLKGQNLLELAGNAPITGKIFTSDSFTYRGEKISKHVPDLQRVLDYRYPGLREVEAAETADLKKEDFKIISNEKLTADISEITVKTKEIAGKAEIGDFVIILISKNTEEIALQISKVDKKKNTITLGYENGKAESKLLSGIKKGESLVSVKGSFKFDIQIADNGALFVGEKQYPLTELPVVLKAIKASGMKPNLVVDSDNKRLICLSKKEYCMCNNYKNVLSRAQTLMEINNNDCTICIRSKKTPEISFLELVEGVILLDPTFAEVSDETLYMDQKALNLCDDSKDPGMFVRAIASGQNSIEKLGIPFGKTIELSSSNIAHSALQKNGLEYELTSDPERPVIKINMDKCIGCGKCIVTCPYQAISFDITKQQYVFGARNIRKAKHDTTVCYTCALCVASCPVNAISVVRYSPEFIKKKVEDIPSVQELIKLDEKAKKDEKQTV